MSSIATLVSPISDSISSTRRRTFGGRSIGLAMVRDGTPDVASLRSSSGEADRGQRRDLDDARCLGGRGRRGGRDRRRHGCRAWRRGCCRSRRRRGRRARGRRGRGWRGRLGSRRGGRWGRRAGRRRRVAGRRRSAGARPAARRRRAARAGPDGATGRAPGCRAASAPTRRPSAVPGEAPGEVDRRRAGAGHGRVRPSDRAMPRPAGPRPAPAGRVRTVAACVADSVLASTIAMSSPKPIPTAVWR